MSAMGGALTRRYIPNPFLHAREEGSQKVTIQWVMENASEYAAKISSQKGDEESLECGAYTGLCGCAFGLMRAADLLPTQKQALFNRAEHMINEHLEYKKSHSRSAWSESNFLLGTLSVYLTRILLDHAKGKTINTKLLKRIEELGEAAVRGSGRGKGDDEMLVGRAGYLAAVLNIRVFVGDDLISAEVIRRVVTAIVESGRDYSERHKSPCPLMYQYYGTEYLGAAHGLIGILQMLLSFAGFLDANALSDVFDSVDWLVSIQEENGNVAPAVDEIKHNRGANELVHWCHGASGFVPLLIVAYMLKKEEKYLQAAKKALSLIWEKGVLLKGPGICHGVSSSGYAFLLFYRLTHDKEYLDAARCFAFTMCSKTFLRQARTPDTPLSLYEGIAGALCFLCDVAQAEQANFPLIPIHFPLPT